MSKLKSYIPKYKQVTNPTFDYKFTVFTPVYNRANTLHRVFDSLNNQTFKDFELVLINDGSTDDSHVKALELIKSANFKVNYVNNKDNQHKMACFYQAIHLAKGEFLLTLDSDDACIPEALDIFHEAYEEIPNDKKNNIAAITGLCMYENGTLVGSLFKEQPFYSNTFEKNLKYPSSGEKWGFTKTSILKSIIVNTEIFSKGLIPEGIIWEYIAKQGFQTKYINNIVRIYYEDADNRLSTVDYERNAFGMAIYSLSVLNWFYKDYLWSNPKYFIKRTYALLRASKYLNFSKKEYIKTIDSNLIKCIVIIAWPFKNLLK